MRSYILLGVLLALVFFFFGCKNSKQVTNTNAKEKNTDSEVDYILAKNYFVNNDILDTQLQKEFVITTREEFEKYFSPAAFMGEEGQPTQIDFDKQACLCIIMPQSDIQSTLIPLSIHKTKDNTLRFDYRFVLGKRVSYFLRNCMIAVIDKDNLCEDVVFHKVFNR